jgi:flagellar biogenesis protein FliO
LAPGQIAGLVIGLILGIILILLILAYIFRRKIEKYRKQKDVELVLVANQGPAPGKEKEVVYKM